MCELGADGIELHCAHGYLIAQFLSRISNRRSDDYGGTWENRCRFMREVARAVRAAVPGIVVGARFSPEMIAGGLTEDDNLRAARILADEGLIDYVSVSLGVQSTHPLRPAIPSTLPHGLPRAAAGAARSREARPAWC